MATVNLIPPPPSPAVNEVSASTGGSLAEGYYEVGFMGYTAPAHTVGSILSQVSPVSRSIVYVSASGAIGYDVTPDPSGSYLYILMRSLDGINGGKWLNIGYSSGQMLSPVTSTTYWNRTITKFYNAASCWVSNMLNFEYRDQNPYGLGTDTGEWLLTVGTGNLLFDELSNAVYSSSMVEGQDYLASGQTGLIANIKLDLTGGNDTTFNLDGKRLYCLGIYNLGGTLQFNTYSQRSIYSNSRIELPKFHTQYPVYNYLGQATLRDIVLCAPNCPQETYCISYPTMVLDAGSKIINSVVHNITFPTQNVISLCSKSSILSNQITPLEGEEFSDNEAEVQIFFLKNNWIARDMVIMSKYGTYNWLLYPAEDITCQFIDCKFYIQANYLDGDYLDEPNAPLEYSTTLNRIYTYTSAALTTERVRMHFKNTINLTIKDNEGTPIESASIICLNGSSIEEFNTYTDVSGSISKEVLTYVIQTVPGEGAGYINPLGETFDYNPFSFTISKDGYNTETFTKTITEKITLDPFVMTPTSTGGSLSDVLITTSGKTAVRISNDLIHIIN